MKRDHKRRDLNFLFDSTSFFRPALRQGILDCPSSDVCQGARKLKGFFFCADCQALCLSQMLKIKVSNEQKAGCLGYIGDYMGIILPNYVTIMMNHYQEP